MYLPTEFWLVLWIVSFVIGQSDNFRFYDNHIENCYIAATEVRYINSSIICRTFQSSDELHALLWLVKTCPQAGQHIFVLNNEFLKTGNQTISFMRTVSIKSNASVFFFDWLTDRD